MQSVRTQSRKTDSSRLHAPRPPVSTWPEKPPVSYVSSSRLSALLALALGLMVTGLFVGWGIVNMPGLVHRAGMEHTLRFSYSVRVGAHSSQASQDTTAFIDTDVSPTVMASPSPAVDPHLLQNHALTGGHIYIPALGLDAPIETTNVDTNGRLQMPLFHPWDGTGWYQGGPYPGQWGSAVIDGSGQRPDGSPAIFERLRQLLPGDKVSVIGAHGDVTSFHVVNVQSYASVQTPAAGIFADNSGIYLNLITNIRYGSSATHLVIVHAKIDS